MKAHFQTDQGQIRSHNEDAGGVFYNQTGQLLAVIADGMGGHQAGDVASQMATSMIQVKWENTKVFHSSEESESWLTEILQETNRTLLDHAQNNEACAGMGTTVVAVICTDEFFAVSHVGDSRCYKLDDDGFRQITEDHSLVNELVRSGQISKDDAEQHPRKNVLLKALGTEADIAADSQSIEWESDSKLLLCSDGLTNKLTDDELSSFIHTDRDPESISNRMIELANDRGGEDNISLIIVHHDTVMEEGEA
ncbi:Stp1/IreP family PP2C-type Ser/Thr phosphatase [Lentibacillus salicampi]|uniref:protein-serine/threonine phosphatase n=1 Tax=Lentibacillus salicampi TaxID=175306 RepID=A0A4Y9AJL5_9BACI|nr:Stp1/IreP family PP2C-type Ser/Thr phosphatase [Lentibacillus salicampi]TFJ94604.1 Stp1/IreP family PP2C-type Ser/Thr phosphatase [Lentibacillus salicampi]